MMIANKEPSLVDPVAVGKTLFGVRDVQPLNYRVTRYCEAFGTNNYSPPFCCPPMGFGSIPLPKCAQ